jgi:hypothetical protein
VSSDDVPADQDDLAGGGSAVPGVDVVIRPALVGWKARPRPHRHDPGIDDRAVWRLTRRAAIRKVNRRLARDQAKRGPDAIEPW